MARRKLDEFPATSIGWCRAPETVANYPTCDVDGCTQTPEFEIYFWHDPDFYWYYMCLTHKDYFARRKASHG